MLQCPSTHTEFVAFTFVFVLHLNKTCVDNSIRMCAIKYIMVRLEVATVSDALPQIPEVTKLERLDFYTSTNLQTHLVIIKSV